MKLDMTKISFSLQQSHTSSFISRKHRARTARSSRFQETGRITWAHLSRWEDNLCAINGRGGDNLCAINEVLLHAAGLINWWISESEPLLAAPRAEQTTDNEIESSAAVWLLNSRVNLKPHSYQEQELKPWFSVSWYASALSSQKTGSWSHELNRSDVKGVNKRIWNTSAESIVNFRIMKRIVSSHAF